MSTFITNNKSENESKVLFKFFFHSSEDEVETEVLLDCLSSHCTHSWTFWGDNILGGQQHVHKQDVRT